MKHGRGENKLPAAETRYTILCIIPLKFQKPCLEMATVGRRTFT